MMAVVQQQPVSPDPLPQQAATVSGSACSPGALNVTLVVALPLNAAPIGPPCSTVTFGRGASNFTSPGPRYFAHSSSPGGGAFRGCAFDPLVYLPSSTAYVVIASGTPTLAFSVVAFDSAAIG